VNVLLIVIDAATPHVVCPAVQTGALPNLERVAAAGEMHPASVSIFPSITPAATTSIITGEYPAQHGIAGAAWYDAARDEIAYYGDDFWVIAKEGFGAFLRDFLIRLNGDRLKAPTLFERVERAGFQAACLNYLVHRGLATHPVQVPWLLAMLPGVPLAETVTGPTTLCLGDFVPAPRWHDTRLRGKEGILHRFGMDDASTATLLCELASTRQFPDLTVAYFADNDYRSHEVGPHAALPVVARVDAALGAMFDAAGGFDAFISSTCIIVTSDHGHCDVLSDRDRAVVDLANVLGDFRQASLGRRWRSGDELMICPNMRAAQLYLRGEVGETRRDRVARTLLLEPRVDLVMWRSTDRDRGDARYTALGPRGRLDFWIDERATTHDDAGNPWCLAGDLDTLALQRDGHRVFSVDYPNALERIAGALGAPNSGDLWVTAQPGCEFEVTGGKAHVGGASHGALHALDSLSPVIAAGLRARLPRAMRSVDLAPLILETLGVPSPHALGGPRTRRYAATQCTRGLAPIS
jgi:hypothetical protein